MKKILILFILLFIAISGAGIGFVLAQGLMNQSTNQAVSSPTSSKSKKDDSVKKISSPDIKAKIAGGSIELLSETSSVMIGDQVEMNVWVDPKETFLLGFDVIAKVDLDSWEIISSQFSLNKESGYTAFPLNSVNLETGLIELSGVTNPELPVNKRQKVASLLLRPKVSGSLNIPVVFEEIGERNDSNLAQYNSEEDALVQTVDFKIMVN